jgi:hypothetical protein
MVPSFSASQASLGSSPLTRHPVTETAFGSSLPDWVCARQTPTLRLDAKTRVASNFTEGPFILFSPQDVISSVLIGTHLTNARLTLLPPESLQTLRVKIAAIVLCFLLAFGEISALRHDRQEAYDRHKEDMQEIVSRFTGLHQDVVALQSNLSATQQTDLYPLTI